jgi:hypothetical protein
MYSTNPDVIETDLADELILLDPATQQMFSLNATGRAIWRALPAPGEAELAEAVAAQFEVTAEQACADVQALLRQLLDAKLVRAGHGERQP